MLSLDIGEQKDRGEKVGTKGPRLLIDNTACYSDDGYDNRLQCHWSQITNQFQATTSLWTVNDVNLAHA